MVKSDKILQKVHVAPSISVRPTWVIHAPVAKLHRTALVITIKQLLSLDIIKAGQYVEGEVNPKV